MDFYELNKKMNEVKNEGATGLEIPVAMWAAGMVGWWWPEIEKAAYKAFKAGKKWFKGEPIEEIIQKLEAKKNIDKQLYAKYPKGSKVDKATVSEIIKMYKQGGIDVDSAVKIIKATLKAVPGTDMYVVK